MKLNGVLTKHHPNKSLGQHFLINTGVQGKIIEACDFLSTDTVLEIGPGTGVLTRRIAPRVKKVFAIEKDKALAQKLSEEFQNQNVNVISADILKFSLDTLTPPIKLVGNLPYYISTPIIEKIIEYRHCFKDVFIMVQLEYGERMCARPNNKEYGSLSCFVQYYFQPKILFKISPGSFNPPPKVYSCFMRLKTIEQKIGFQVDEEFLFKLIRTAFSQRRKTLHNSLKPLIAAQTWARMADVLKFKETTRAENVDLEGFVRMAEFLKENATG